MVLLDVASNDYGLGRLRNLSTYLLCDLRATCALFYLISSLTVVSPNGPRAAIVCTVVYCKLRDGVLGGESCSLALAAVELRLLLSPAHAHELQ